MSDVSKTNAELITEARKIAHIAKTKLAPGTPSLATVDMPRALLRMADALEAAARVPVQGEPNDDREMLVKILEPVEALIEGAETLELGYEVADAILTAGFSRATVPDAATELRPMPENGCDKQAHDTMNRNINRVFENNTGLMYALEVVKGERDAAIAALERVRAAVEKHRHWNDDCGWDVPVIEVLAALDGAPEPEWEYQWGEPGERFEGFDSFVTEELARAEMELDSDYPSHRVMRRRKAGPWLPVGGESSGK